MEEPSPPSDGALAVAATCGDLDAFGTLAQRYRRAVERIAASIAGAEAAEDVAQDVFLLAFKALPDLDEPESFAAWLSAITRNRAIRWLRNERRMPRVEFDDTLLLYIDAASAREGRSASASADLAADVVEGIERLPEGLRLTMRLRWLDEMPIRQIAAFTGVPASSVKWRLFEGKRLLRERTSKLAKGEGV